MKTKISLLIAVLFFLFLSARTFADGRTGCLYWGWNWPTAADYNIKQLDMDLTITNDPQTNVILFFSTELNCGTPSQQTVCYFGLQTNTYDKGKGVLFSRWDTIDLSNAQSAGTADSWTVVGDWEGQFISVCRLFDWTTHRYILRLTSTEAEDDDVGRWFHFSIIDTETQEETYVGALRFPKDSSGKYPTLLTQGFGSFLEQPAPVPTQDDVPLWKIGIGRPAANDQTLWASSANWWFAPVSDTQPWQNNDIWAEGETIYGQIGGDTVRTHGDTGSLSYVVISNVSKQGSPFRLIISGSKFQSDAMVYIGDDQNPWTNMKYKSASQILLKGGTGLKNLFPKGVPVKIKVVNGDGGSAGYTYTR